MCDAEYESKSFSRSSRKLTFHTAALSDGSYLFCFQSTPARGIMSVVGRDPQPGGRVITLRPMLKSLMYTKPDCLDPAVRSGDASGVSQSLVGDHDTGPQFRDVLRSCLENYVRMHSSDLTNRFLGRKWCRQSVVTPGTRPRGRRPKPPTRPPRANRRPRRPHRRPPGGRPRREAKRPPLRRPRSTPRARAPRPRPRVSRLRL